MAVTREEKQQELEDLTSAFSGADTAVLVDYKGLNVPQVTELRRQIRGARASYKVPFAARFASVFLTTL